MTFAELRADVVVLACAASAGIHAALAPEHFRVGTGAGGGFLAASVLLAAIVVLLTRWPSSSVVAFAAAAVLAGLIASYVLATTTGVPVLQPEPEAVDGLALATKAIEAVGLLAAWSLVSSRVALPFHSPKTRGTLT